jgi:hypothetical protein
MAVSGAGNRPIVQVTGGQGASTATALRDEILGLLATGPDMRSSSD